MGEASRRIREELKRAADTAAAKKASPAEQDAAVAVMIASLVSIGHGEPGALGAFFEAMASRYGEIASRVKALGVAIGCLADEGRTARVAINPEQLAVAQKGAIRVAESAVAFCGRASLGVLQPGFETLDNLLAPAGDWPAMRVSPLAPLRREFETFLTRFGQWLADLERVAAPPSAHQEKQDG